MGAARPRTRSPEIPAASLGHACAVLALGRRASPSTRRGTRLPWPLRAAVFSGSWRASCCPYPHPPLGPCLRDPILSSGWRGAASGASPVRPSREITGPARVCGCRGLFLPGALVSVLLPLSSVHPRLSPLSPPDSFWGFSLPAGALLPALS